MEGLIPTALTNQFILAYELSHIPQGWVVYEHGGWQLAAHPSLSVLTLHSKDGAMCGWVLGVVISQDGSVVQRSLVLQGSTDAELGQVLAALRGRFALIVLERERQRIYPDAAASLSLVFGQGQGPAAATPSLFDLRQFPRDVPLIEGLGMPGSGKWYPFGLTPRQGVQRLLPNHFLDLQSWQQKRFWPTAVLEVRDSTISDLIKPIGERMRSTIAAVADRWYFHLPLTAGQDSRVLLAAARDVIARGRCFVMSTGRTDMDAAMARRVAHQAGVELDVLPTVSGSQQDLDRWLYLTGESVAGRIARDYVTLKRLSPSWALLPGTGGEVGRGFYWREDDFYGESAHPEPLTPETVIRRIKLPVVEPLVSRAAAWLASLAGQSRLAVLDLLYIEQRLGCWAGPQQYGVDPFVACHLSPFTDRVVFEAMLGLPVFYRREARLARDLCQLMWPQLADLPFNEWPGFRGWAARLRRQLHSLSRRHKSTPP